MIQVAFACTFRFARELFGRGDLVVLASLSRPVSLLFVRVKDRPRLLPLGFALFLCMSHLVEIG